MKPVRFAVLLSAATLALAACNTGGDTNASMSSATSAAGSAASEAASDASSAMSSATSAMAQPGDSEVTVEVDGSPLAGNFMNITCTPGDSNDDETDADDMNEGPELNIESQKGEPHELDIDINNPDDNPVLDNLDIMVDQTRLETEDQQEMGATVTRDGNKWMVETDAFHTEGPEAPEPNQGKVVKVKVNVTCPA